MMSDSFTAESNDMLKLWRAVAAVAITDAAREIVMARGTKARNAAIDRHRRYFHGRDWREVCETAGITHNPSAVMRYLTSDRAKSTARECMLEMGAISSITALRHAAEAAE